MPDMPDTPDGEADSKSPHAPAPAATLVRTAGPKAEAATANTSVMPDAAGDTAADSKSVLPDVAFIGDRADDAAFADLDGNGTVENPEHMLRGWTRLQLEAVVGEWNTVPSALLEILSSKRRAVARIVVPGGDLTDFAGNVQPNGWKGTAFLVGDNLLVTNHHVLNSPEVARQAEAEFDYEVPAGDLLAGKRNGLPAIKRFRLDPDRLFVTSKASDGGLDYTFVWIDEAATKEFSFIGMERASFTVQRFDPVFIVHHPQGRLKEVSLDDTETLRMRSTVIHYAADTDYGSSGSPVFDRDGRLIALHHARSDEPDTLQDGRQVASVNEGVKISAIALDLENRIKDNRPDAAMAEKILACMTGSDTLASFFGGLGRVTTSATDVEAVVDVYKGTEQDVDIGFWNLDWLAASADDPLTLGKTATVIVDLNLDIWCLSQIARPTMEKLLAQLKARFGETYDAAFADLDVPTEGLNIAVLWKPRTVGGGRMEWPEPIRSWWRLQGGSAVPFKTTSGRVFERYPGLYRFTVLGRDGLSPFTFNLVPLCLAGMGESGKQRRFATMLLARAVRRMIDGGDKADWIVGGDINEELASGDFDDVIDADFEAMSGADPTGGAFAYLRMPASPIHSIFLSPNVSRTAGGSDYFIPARGKSLDKYVKQVADQRPVVLRVSLSGAMSADTLPDADLRALVDQIAGKRETKRQPVAAQTSGDSTPPGDTTTTLAPRAATGDT